MKVSAEYVQEHFTDIINAASSGEEIEIALSGKPALFLASRTVAQKNTTSARPRAAFLGSGEGMIALPTDDEWRAMDKEIEEEMLNGPIFPLERL